MENEPEKTSAGDDPLNGDTAEVKDDAPTVDATDEKTEQQTEENGEDAEEEPSEALLAKIKAQVEVYFIFMKEIV